MSRKFLCSDTIYVFRSKEWIRRKLEDGQFKLNCPQRPIFRNGGSIKLLLVLYEYLTSSFFMGIIYSVSHKVLR